MIYTAVEKSEPICQGDIFNKLPRVDISLQTTQVFDPKTNQFETMDWNTILENWPCLSSKKPEAVNALLPVRTVSCIVATQDCDASRAPEITLCVIMPFEEVERKAQSANSAKSWRKLITQQARMNLKWFYLPPDQDIGFTNKMAVDFRMPIRIQREELEAMKMLRRGRLNDEARQHFRERISEFYRRYPYDEWYPLNTEEFENYQKDGYPDATPRPWQIAPS